jgi:outer membrane protein assembly factor BamB
MILPPTLAKSNRLFGDLIVLSKVRPCSLVLTSSLLLFSHSIVHGDDWPQWMGPTRDGEYRESGLLTQFPEKGPQVLWRTPCSGGYAGPSVANGRVYLFDYVKRSGEEFNNPGQRAVLDGEERLLCLDLTNGQVIWEHRYNCPYSISYPAGPRCTPTVADDKVYILGSEGNLKCLKAATGDVVWERSFKQDYQAAVPIWGFSAHPLVHGDLVICMVGGENQTVVAFHKETGEEVWKGLSASAVGYCPPSVIEAAGVEQLIVWHADAIVGMNPSDGSVYWTAPLQPAYEMAIARPQRWGDLLYASGIGNKSLLLRLKKDVPGVEEVWTGKTKDSVYCANSTPIFHDGVIYGSDCGVGSFIAVNSETAERFWESFEPTRKGEKRRISHGTAFVTHLANTNRFLLFSELGDLIIAELTPAGYREISRAHVIEPSGECFGRDVVWSHPAYANRTAFIRNDNEIIAVSLAE